MVLSVIKREMCRCHVLPLIYPSLWPLTDFMCDVYIGDVDDESGLYGVAVGTMVTQQREDW